MRYGRWVIVLLLTAAAGAAARAQTTGEIGGAVTDEQGLGVTGVTVTLAGNLRPSRRATAGGLRPGAPPSL